LELTNAHDFIKSHNITTHKLPHVAGFIGPISVCTQLLNFFCM